MKIRVLASSGVATGMGECVLHLPTHIPPSAASIVLTSGARRADDPDHPVLLSNRSVRVHVFDAAGRNIRDPGFVWFDQDGRQIGRGHSLDLRRAAGARTIRVVATNYLSRSAAPTRTWIVEREGNKIRLRPQARSQPGPDAPGRPGAY